MKRENGIIELTEREVKCLYQRKFNSPIPPTLSLKDAATAAVFYIGVERVEQYLTECVEGGRL